MSLVIYAPAQRRLKYDGDISLEYRCIMSIELCTDAMLMCPMLSHRLEGGISLCHASIATHEQFAAAVSKLLIMLAITNRVEHSSTSSG